MANTDTSSRQGHPPPRTTAKEIAQQESMNKLLVNKRNRTGAHSDNKRDSNRGDIHDEEEEMQNWTSLRALRISGKLATTWQELVHGLHDPDL